MFTTTFPLPLDPGGLDAPVSATIDLAARRRRSVTLPDRFDVHRVGVVFDELDREIERGGPFVIDGSHVQMIDLAAIESLRGLLERHPELRIERPSVALRATVEFTNAGHIAAALDDDSLPEAA